MSIPQIIVGLFENLSGTSVIEYGIPPVFDVIFKMSLLQTTLSPF